MRIKKIETLLNELIIDSKNDNIKMMKVSSKSSFRLKKPADFKDMYIPISKNQGEDLIQLIVKNKLRNIVEFGTSFGISTLFLALGAIETDGRIITTELIESKAKKAIENFNRAGVNKFIEVRVGDASETLKNHSEPVDLLVLDGWKNLYLTIFQMLEPNFHNNSIIYVDNADMLETQVFLEAIRKKSKYKLTTKDNGKVVLIYINS